MTGQSNQSQGVKRQLGKGLAIAGSGTGLALFLNWIVKLNSGIELPADVAIFLAGALSFAAGRAWNITAQVLKKKWDIDIDG